VNIPKPIIINWLSVMYDAPITTITDIKMLKKKTIALTKKIDIVDMIINPFTSLLFQIILCKELIIVK